MALRAPVTAEAGRVHLYEKVRIEGARRRRDWMLIACVGIIFSAVVAKTVWAYLHTPNAALIDFRAFYCGARVAMQGVDPYLSRPLFHCEAQLQVAGYPTGGIGVPAPLPGALFLVLAPLGWLPYGTAVALWLAILFAAILVTTLLLADLTRLPVALVGASVGLGEAYAAIGTGNLAPLAVLAIVLCAWLLERRKYAAAALAASIALLEPHLGAPAAAALLIWVPKSRRWVALFASVVAFASVAYLGPHSPAEYVFHVLPTQAIAEAYAWNQYSLTFLLTALGADAAIASKISSVFFVGILLFSIVMAKPVSRSLGNSAAIVLFPTAAVMFGGPYVHFAQVIAALPFALLLFSRHQTMPVFAAVVALSIPGYALLTEPLPAILLTVATTATMAATLPAIKLRSLLSILSITATAAFAIAWVAGAPIHDALSVDADRETDGVARIGDVAPDLLGTPASTAGPLLALVMPVWAALALIIFRPYPGTLSARVMQRLRPLAANRNDLSSQASRL